MSIRLATSIAAARASRAALHLCGKEASTLPGRIALAINPKAIRDTCEGAHVIVVTGTNGKTTTSHMIAQILRKAGYAVTSNAAGANLASGIAGTCIDIPSASAEKPRYAVIECDEATLRQVARDLNPQAIVVTNLFRDQLDRYGELDTTRQLIAEGIAQTRRAHLFLNADCPLCASLADCGRPARFFGMGSAPAREASTQANTANLPTETTRCMRCGHSLEYRFRSYGHLGSYHCPQCGYDRPALDVEASDFSCMDEHGSSFAVREGMDSPHHLRVGLPATFNIYNALAALAVTRWLGVSESDISHVLEHIRPCQGRMEHMMLGRTPLCMILVKNPVGMDQALSFLRSMSPKTRIVFGLNDKAADGEDISWIWDANFEGTFFRRPDEAGPCKPPIAVGGTRGREMALRLKYSGANERDLRLWESMPELASFIKSSPDPVYLLLNYTSMREVHHYLSHAGAKDLGGTR